MAELRYLLDCPEFPVTRVYIKCDLERSSRGNTGATLQCATTWIPERMAVKGKRLVFRNGSSWSCNWVVAKVHKALIGVHETYDAAHLPSAVLAELQPKAKVSNAKKSVKSGAD